MNTNWFSRLLPSRYDGFVLALGGGGGRGLAHLGVLEALEAHQLRPDAIIGVSIGALFGAMYAHHPDITAVKAQALDFLHSDTMTELQLPKLQQQDAGESFLNHWANLARQTMLYARAASDISLMDAELLITVAEKLCKTRDFSELQIPFSCTAVDFPCGDCTLFTQGDLVLSVAASMAIPGIFAPVEVDGKRYVDGGLASEIPSLEARQRASNSQCVVSVNVGAKPSCGATPTHLLSMLDWASLVKSYYLRRYDKEHTEILIEPLVGDVQWDDFSHPRDEIARGRAAAEEQMGTLLHLLGKD
ncbi:MAG: patatin-like phospholipase family protein [Mariprofundales bacterium]|nr:patatin-like phospholipase family protein [Mariprofundales bacterium]